jgi:hypothetical protein
VILGIIQSIIISNTSFTKAYANLAAVGQRSEHGNGQPIDLPNPLLPPAARSIKPPPPSYLL